MLVEKHIMSKLLPVYTTSIISSSNFLLIYVIVMVDEEERRKTIFRHPIHSCFDVFMYTNYTQYSALYERAIVVLQHSALCAYYGQLHVHDVI